MVVIGCCLPNTKEIALAGTAFCRSITEADAHLTVILSDF